MSSRTTNLHLSLSTIIASIASWYTNHSKVGPGFRYWYILDTTLLQELNIASIVNHFWDIGKHCSKESRSVESPILWLCHRGALECLLMCLTGPQFLKTVTSCAATNQTLYHRLGIYRKTHCRWIILRKIVLFPQYRKMKPFQVEMSILIFGKRK